MNLAPMKAAIGGIKTAVDIVKAIADLNKNVEINTKVIELQNIILGLQSSLLTIQTDFSELAVQNESLAQQIAEHEQWKTVEHSYTLQEVDDDVFVYASLDQKNKGLPAHWLCTNCFPKRKRSILQMYNHNQFGRFYRCPECGTEITVRR